MADDFGDAPDLSYEDMTLLEKWRFLDKTKTITDIDRTSNFLNELRAELEELQEEVTSTENVSMDLYAKTKTIQSVGLKIKELKSKKTILTTKAKKKKRVIKKYNNSNQKNPQLDYYNKMINAINEQHAETADDDLFALFADIREFEAKKRKLELFLQNAEKINKVIEEYQTLKANIQNIIIEKNRIRDLVFRDAAKIVPKITPKITKIP